MQGLSQKLNKPRKGEKSSVPYVLEDFAKVLISKRYMSSHRVELVHPTDESLLFQYNYLEVKDLFLD